MRKHIRKTVIRMILPLTLLFLAAACAFAPLQPPPGRSEGRQAHYPFDDDKVLNFVGMPLASIKVGQDTVIFNEITDIEAYRAFNTAYGYQNQPYYSTRTTGLDLLMEHPVRSESDFLDVSSVYKDGFIESRKPLDSFLTYGEKAPAAAALATKILEKKIAPDVRACYHGGPDASGFKFYPESNCVATVVIGKDLAAIDERFTHILPILHKPLGTECSSMIGEQEIAVHHFYQNRLYNGSETEEAFQYYAYYEKDGLQYLYQFSSNWALTGQSTGALHNPPAVLYRTNTQEECRELFLECLLALVSETFSAAAHTPAPDEVSDAYVEYETNAQGGIDKEAAEKHAAEARMPLQLEQMEAISTAAVEIGQGDPKAASRIFSSARTNGHI